jgi:hypothetical protein
MTEQTSETIRQWYFRTTRRPRKAILYASILSFVAMWISWGHMPPGVLVKIQAFNSALTLPTLAILWTSALVFMFLRPTREAAFRSQECMDAGIKSLEKRVDIGINEMEKRLDNVTKIFSEALNNKIIPAMDCWNRVGQRIEKVVVDGLFDDMKEALKEIKATAKQLEAKATEGNGEIKKFVTDTAPTVEALKRIHARLDRELGDGFVEDVRSALQSVRELGGMPSMNTKPTVLPIGPRPAVPAPIPETAAASAPETVEIKAPIERGPEIAPPLLDTSHPVVIEKPVPAQKPAPVPAKEPDLDRALRVISKKKVVAAGKLE